ncbi:MAG: phenylalanine--tRNA ligase subunit beta [Candidatus Paceibacterota bacterium]
MKISHNWLQTYFDKPIPSTKELEALFAAHSFEVEDINEAGWMGSGETDSVFEIKVLPDMAHYCLSHEGVASEISFITGLKMKNRLASEVKVNIKDEPKVKVNDPKFCRRYMTRIVEVSPLQTHSPPWIYNLLDSIGQRSISPIVDITNYVMYDIGQPLHAFAADKVHGSLCVRPAKDGEKIVLLDGRELILTTSDNVIADDEGPLVVAGAKGGKRAEISEQTKRIIIESANFEPTVVRRTSTKYDIRSDSSKRFENEITPELAYQGMTNACHLISKYYPDAKFGPVVDIYPAKTKQTIIEFDPAYLEERLGMKIPLDKAKEILERMGIIVSSLCPTSGKWSLTIPYKRLDLVIKEDIVEEIGRIYGYDHIVGILPPKLPNPPTMNPGFYLCEKIKNILTSKGFSEVSLYTLVEKGEVETLKPLAKDKAFARPDLSLGMAACLERNALNADLLGLEAIKIFEIGHIFKKDSEEIHLAIGARQIKKVKGLKSENLIQEVLETLGKEVITSHSNSQDDSDDVISKAFLQAKIQPTGIVEINLSELVESFASKADLKKLSLKDLNFQPASNKRYTKFSLYPFIVRDIALFVPEYIMSETVWQTIEKGIDKAGAKELLVKHSLFDVFKKDGKTSYAYRLIFQSFERTLTDDEVAKIMNEINGALKAEGWEVR